MTEEDLKKIMLADMKVTGLTFHDIDMTFNNEVRLIGEDGKPYTVYRSAWRAAL